MKFKGRRQSTNVEDMRGSSSGRSIGLKGGLIGTLAIALVVYLLGGNPMDVLRMSNQGQTETTSGEAVLTEQEQEMTEFVSVVLADTEEVWKKIFREYGATYREPKLVLSVRPAVMPRLPQGPSTALVMKKYTSTLIIWRHYSVNWGPPAISPWHTSSPTR